MQWQPNKNLITKLFASDSVVGAAAGFKMWWVPSVSAVASAVYDIRQRRPKFGLSLALENFGDVSYQKGPAQAVITSKWEPGKTTKEMQLEEAQNEVKANQSEVVERGSRPLELRDSESRFL